MTHEVVPSVSHRQATIALLDKSPCIAEIQHEEAWPRLMLGHTPDGETLCALKGLRQGCPYRGWKRCSDCHPRTCPQRGSFKMDLTALAGAVWGQGFLTEVETFIAASSRLGSVNLDDAAGSSAQESTPGISPAIPGRLVELNAQIVTSSPVAAYHDALEASRVLLRCVGRQGTVGSDPKRVPELGAAPNSCSQMQGAYSPSHALFRYLVNPNSSICLVSAVS